MRHGYFMMPLHPPGSLLADTIEHDLAQVQRLEELGFEEAWIGEHFTAEWENIPAPDIFIGAALQRTERIRLGTGVFNLPNHSPFVVAHRAAQLDHMARGRFMFGIGSGGFPGDLEAVNLDPRSSKNREVTHDAIELILKLWESPEPGRYERHHWSFSVPAPDASISKRVHTRPYTRPHPPIAVAGSSARSETLALAGARGWIPMSTNIGPVPVLKTHWETVEEAARANGRPCSRQSWRIGRTIHVAPTSAQALREARDGAIGDAWRRYFIPLMKRSGMIERVKPDPDFPVEAMNEAFFAEHLWIVGDPTAVAAQLRRLYHAVGGFGSVLAIGHDWADRTIWDRSMSLLAEEVMPLLADLDGESPSGLETAPATA